jgi:hypothetical protein
MKIQEARDKNTEEEAQDTQRSFKIPTPAIFTIQTS